MPEVGLFDDSLVVEFGSIALAGKNSYERPQHFTWERDKVLPVTFYMDGKLSMVSSVSDRVMRVAILVDPRTDTYHYKAFAMQDEFDYILTFSKAWIEKARSSKWLYYPMGGSSIPIAEWGIGDKTKSISIFKHGRGSNRYYDAMLSGEIARKASLFGISIFSENPHDQAVDYLQDYRYSIVIERAKWSGYFSSRLIDCLSMGTIPIYWGDPDIGERFDIDGIIPFNNTDELVDICVNRTTEENYLKAIPAIMRNLDACQRYYCAEDYIYVNYPFIFEGKNASL